MSTASKGLAAGASERVVLCYPMGAPMKQSFFLLALTIAQVATAQDLSFPHLLRQAQQFSQSQDWPRAATHWQEVVTANPTHASYWQALATARFETGQYPAAIAAYARKFELLGRRDSHAPFDIARAYARLGQPDSALQYLRQSLALGFRPVEAWVRQPEFRALSRRPDFVQLTGDATGQTLLRQAGWQHDIDFLVREVTRRAFRVPRTITPETFAAEARRIQNSIPRRTDMQLTADLMALMARLGDGHSMVYGFWETPELRQTLPVDFVSCAEGIFIATADQPFRHLLGKEVVEVENRPIARVLDALQPLVSRDNEQGVRFGGLMRLRHVALLHAIGLSAQPNQLVLTLRDARGTTRQVVLPANNHPPTRRLWDGLPETWVPLSALSSAPQPLVQRNPYQPYWFEYLPNVGVVYVQFNRVADDVREPFTAFCERLFAFMQHHSVGKLVLDLRLNYGGDATLLQPLLHGLIRTDSLRQPGRLVVLIGPRTYSAAQVAATRIGQEVPALFVGEPTGSSPNFVGEDAATELPYSHLMVSISDRYWQNAAPNDLRTWIAPDWYIPKRIQALVENRDEVLEAVLGYFGKP